MKWFTQSTSFDYFVFVIWKTIIKDDKTVRKGRVVIDIRELNQITQTNVYLMPTQTDIIETVTDCSHISIVDAQGYFYQWRVKEQDKHKQTIIIHRGQKQFNVAVMSFKNSSAYVQRQIDIMLRDLRTFVKTYIDDIIFFFMSFQEHLNHLNFEFQKLFEYDVILSFKKSYLGYPSITLLGQVIDAFEMSTTKKKLAIIAKLAFPISLKELKTYLSLTDWMRNYVSFYAQVVESLQKRKTLLLKNGSKKDNQRRWFFKQTFLIKLT